MTTQSIREKLECEELLKVPNASGKAAWAVLWARLSVVVFMFEAYNKSVPLSSVCVCVCV